MSNLQKLVSLIPMSNIEIKAQEQIYNALKVPFLLKLAIMPDVHTGYDLPIGGVALLEKYISPSFVGFDIGCGMCHVNTGLTVKELKLTTKNQRERLFNKLLREIPVGFKSLEYSDGDIPFKSAMDDKELDKKVQSKQFIQKGTLGGGNHFIEVGANKKDIVGITIHSGSRNPGHSIGNFYMKKGRFLSLDSDLGKAYKIDMEWALSYALENRRQMMLKVLSMLKLKESIISGMINENHNHAEILTDGTILHRKGATPAAKDQLGIIPANMRDGVFITKGLGNTTFLESASHGCGRIMGRNQAKKNLDLDRFISQMKGIKCTVSKNTLDESPMAYKKYEYVLSLQEGIVINVIDSFKPLLVIKG